MSGSKATVVAEANCFNAIEGVELVVEWHCESRVGEGQVDLEHQDDLRVGFDQAC